MGVPRFFKWLAERYPCIISPLHVPTMPTLHNLYLDMNGIVHVATHGNDKMEKGESEKIQMLKIFAYIDKLFNMCRPTDTFYMAIDGVAPRAKMNQQRQRRFRSAHDTEEAQAKAREKGEELLNPADIFDSNCITPGTPFMERLSEHLQYFIRYKIQTDSNWQKCKVIFSGHDTPGEGEHKIMDFIRSRKMQKGYKPNQTHCIYGLDADLIMLALATHEPHFFLLREDVFEQYQYTKSTDKPISSSFQLLHLSLLREYLDMEFKDTQLGFKYDLERIIDDFVLICFFCGNDFIPHGPSLDIGQNAIGILFDHYKEILPQVGGYFTKEGRISFERLQPFINRIAESEPELMDKKMKMRVEQMNKKRRRGKKIKLGQKMKKVEAVVGPELEMCDIDDIMGDNLEGEELEKELQALEDEEKDDVVDPLTALDLTMEGNKKDPFMLTNEDVRRVDEEEEDDDNPFAGIETPTPTPPTEKKRFGDLLVDSHDEYGNLNFEAWQRSYYQEKLDIDIDDKDAMYKLQKSYIEGLIWVYQYYYYGCPSWKWFFPYCYSPLLSSLKNTAEIARKVKFEMGKPFTPFQQLLGVLPPRSAELLPEIYRTLMCDSQSPLLDLYPRTIKIDREGCKYDYEGVVILPFMDEDRLLEAEAPLRERLSRAEKKRNAFGPPHVFSYDKNISYTARATLPQLNDLPTCHVRVTEYEHPTFKGTYKPRLVKGVKLGKNTLEGYPTFATNHIYQSHLSMAGIRLLGHASKRDTMVIQLFDENTEEHDDVDPLSAYAEQLDRVVHVGYPYPRMGIVTSLSCKNYSLTSEGRFDHDEQQQKDFKKEALKHQEVLKQRQGLDIGEVKVLVYVVLFQQMIVDRNGFKARKFSTADEEYAYPVQTIVQDYKPVLDHKFEESQTKFETSTKPVMVLSKDFYGSTGIVMQNAGKSIRKVTVFLDKTSVPPLKPLTRLFDDKYYPLWKLSKHLKHPERKQVTPAQLGRILGKFLIGDKNNTNWNLGLKIRNTHSNKVLLGLAKLGVSAQSKDDGYLLNYSTMVTRKNEFSTVSSTSQWLFAKKLIPILQSYLNTFPEVFDLANVDQKNFKPSDIYKEDAEKKLGAIEDWIKGLGLSEFPRIHVSREQFPRGLIQEMEQAVVQWDKENPLNCIEEKQVKLHDEEFILADSTSSTPSDNYNQRIELGSRVAYARSFGSVPLGYRGTVVGIQKSVIHVMFDRVFPGATNLRGALTTLRGQSVEENYLVNLTHPSYNYVPKNTGFLRKFDIPSKVYGSHYYSVAAFKNRDLVKPKVVKQADSSPVSQSPLTPPVVHQYVKIDKTPTRTWNSTTPFDGVNESQSTKSSEKLQNSEKHNPKPHPKREKKRSLNKKDSHGKNTRDEKVKYKGKHNKERSKKKDKTSKNVSEQKIRQKKANKQIKPKNVKAEYNSHKIEVNETKSDEPEQAQIPQSTQIPQQSNSSVIFDPQLMQFNLAMQQHMQAMHVMQQQMQQMQAFQTQQSQNLSDIPSKTDSKPSTKPKKKKKIVPNSVKRRKLTKTQK